MRHLLIGILMFLVAFPVSAQNIPVTVKVTPAATAADVKIYIAPLATELVQPIEMTKENDVFKASVAKSKSDFYNVVTVRNGAQLFFPVYGGNKTSIKFDLDYTEGVPKLSQATAEDKALGQYFEYVYAKDVQMWTKPFASVDDVYPFLKGYLTKADSLAKTGIDKKVAQYLNMWAYTHTFDAFYSLPMAAKIKIESLPFKRSELLSDPAQVLNSSTAMLFRSAPQIVFSSLKDKKDLDKCLTNLCNTYTEPALVEHVKRMVVDNYLSTFNYETHYDEGLAAISAATKKYGLDGNYAKEFAKRKATVKGQPFPSGIVLKDVNGKVVDFSSFRGKYVYIDMWASWCGPCCKEVPYLQKLESELKNDKVAFVSISLDTREAQWKKKMEQLKMHGNQLIDSSNAFGNALNVQGIPFFVIYDPQGKLYMYDAPRPSQGQGLVDLLEKLK